MWRIAMCQLVIDGVDFLVDGDEDGVFAPEAGKWWDAGECQAANQKCPVRVRHDPTKSTELAHINHAPHGVHDAAGPEEEQGLEEGVRKEVVHAARHPRKRARAGGEEHIPELADRRISEHSLKIELR